MSPSSASVISSLSESPYGSKPESDDMTSTSASPSSYHNKFSAISSIKFDVPHCLKGPMTVSTLISFHNLMVKWHSMSSWVAWMFMSFVNDFSQNIIYAINTHTGSCLDCHLNLVFVYTVSAVAYRGCCWVHPDDIRGYRGCRLWTLLTPLFVNGASLVCNTWHKSQAHLQFS
jgi:hypothetical protein